ncbi:unnamed protein product [Allacma fusca]|uniref:Brix domain-containing protein n=1 Tax=Allacma fusca TaxID=39272 RepID=A0A8J2LSF7_9HEXA|nr:unnamed protein product [Allacma fusca]
MSSESENEVDVKEEKPILEDYNELIRKANKIPVKHKRREEIRKAIRQKKKLKKKDRDSRRKEAEALGEDAPPKQVPHTLESLREKDETMVNHEGSDSEVEEDIKIDEFESYFNQSYVPKVVITSSANPCLKTRLFLKELCQVIPNSTAFHRRQSAVKKMISSSIERGFTDVIVINEHNKEPCSMLVTHLPTGPTAFFRLSNVKLTKHIKRDWREITSHRPEVILNNFNTRLGVTIGRMLGVLFHYDPQFKGRRVATFHNQRDYIFFRHHRYEFKKDGQKAALRELGPRFTLKLKSLQHGTFDSKTGEYEWIITNKRHQMETSRRKFFL